MANALRGSDLIGQLKRTMGISSDGALARRLEVTSTTLNNWRKHGVSVRSAASAIKRLATREARLEGHDVIRRLSAKFGVSTLPALARALGVSAPTVYGWRDHDLNERMLAELVVSVHNAGAEVATSNVIQPIVEFYPISPTLKRKKYEIFGVENHNGREHRHRTGLRETLAAPSARGVYMFYDSVGSAIYAGKAKRQSIWAEANNVLNRERGTQKIRVVRHPKSDVAYRGRDELTRQIVPRQFQLHHMASFFSAYSIQPDLIDDIEALLIRGFANDLLNIRMEAISPRA